MSGLLFLIAASRAADAAAPVTSAYASFVSGARAQHGLFTVYDKGGKVYLELLKTQLDHDFMETITTGNGTGMGLWWGDTDYLPAEIVRFERHDDKIAIVWPNWYAHVGQNPNAKLAVAGTLPDSVIGLGAIAAEDDQHVVFDLASLASDQLDLKNTLNERFPPDKQYRLDPDLSYFERTKAFPENDVITVAQSWVTDAKHVIDTAPDARRVLIKIVYNFTQLPNDDYRPRLSDDRVGIYNDIYLDFSSESVQERKLRYFVRWNFDPADTSRPSPARHPMVIYLSKTIPPQYRGAVRDGCLEWNKAFEKIGILNAVVVKDQPDDPDWDPEDVRYSVIRWLTEAQPGFGASSQTLFDPRNGEEFRTGVLVSGEEGLRTQQTWRYVVDPVRFGRSTDPVPDKFMHDSIFATVLHEMGHNLGLQHNFIGSDVYTAKDLQSLDFTSKNGITTSAMEYAPLNLWPRSDSQGDYYQTTIGPYDYYAIKYGYATIPGASTPEAELPTLEQWGQAWSNPLYRYGSDEDVEWADGHAADPRIEQGDLTNDSLGWCQVQIGMARGVLASLNALEPHDGGTYEDASTGFAYALGQMLRCSTLPAHWIGGQYLSRAHRGDPNAAPPIVPVPYAEEKRAFAMLDADLFADSAWNFPASLLNKLGYSEWAAYSYTSWPGPVNLPLWAYDPPDRHDFPVVNRVNRMQIQTIDFFFAPLVL
ncbi:MAG: zinc-dependent metalloprotease, partial [Candidatus Eremiobacteraeota bacterium]|nr:zinc-dependent metalloprotease [Candidatus Eremiobacteraeota bacterium]